MVGRVGIEPNPPTLYVLRRPTSGLIFSERQIVELTRFRAPRLNHTIEFPTLRRTNNAGDRVVDSRAAAVMDRRAVSSPTNKAVADYKCIAHGAQLI